MMELFTGNTALEEERKQAITSVESARKWLFGPGLKEWMTRMIQAQLMSSKVFVVFDESGQPRTDGRKVILSPDLYLKRAWAYVQRHGFSLEDLVLAMIGDLVHEFLHLRYTDFPLLKDFLEIMAKGGKIRKDRIDLVIDPAKTMDPQKSWGKIFLSLNNILEDGFINRAGRVYYRKGLFGMALSHNDHLLGGYSHENLQASLAALSEEPTDAECVEAIMNIILLDAKWMIGPITTGHARIDDFVSQHRSLYRHVTRDRVPASRMHDVLVLTEALRDAFPVLPESFSLPDWLREMLSDMSKEEVESFARELAKAMKKAGKKPGKKGEGSDGFRIPLPKEIEDAFAKELAEEGAEEGDGEGEGKGKGKGKGEGEGEGKGDGDGDGKGEGKAKEPHIVKLEEEASSKGSSKKGHEGFDTLDEEGRSKLREDLASFDLSANEDVRETFDALLDEMACAEDRLTEGKRKHRANAKELGSQYPKAKTAGCSNGMPLRFLPMDKPEASSAAGIRMAKAIGELKVDQAESLLRAKNALQQLLRSNLEWREGGHFSGKLDRSALFRADTTGTIFYRDHARSREKDLAIAIAIDMSGSMNSSSLQQLAYYFGQLAHSLRVPFGLYGHQAEYDNDIYDVLVIKDIKDDIEQLDVASLLQSNGGTRDAIMWPILEDILVKTGKRDKMIIHITDGVPHHDSHSRSYMASPIATALATALISESQSQMKKMAMRGIPVIGICLSDDHNVQEQLRLVYEDRYVAAATVEEASLAFLALLKKNLFG